MSRAASKTKTVSKRRQGRPKSKRPSKGRLWLVLHKSDFPSIEKLLSSKNPQVLYDEFGIDLPRDLSWSSASQNNISQRAGAILEAIARGQLKGSSE